MVPTGRSNTAVRRFYKTFYLWSHHSGSACQSPRQQTRQRTQKALHSTSNTSRCYPIPRTRHQPSRTQTAAYATSKAASSDHEDPAKRAAARMGGSTSNLNILPDLSSHMRQLMRLVPHPVAVVTASSGSASDPDVPTSSSSPESTFRGMTISSFNTVTLSPTPIVSFNVRVPSATFTAMSANTTFLVHLLYSSPTGARIAEAFTKGNNEQGDGFRALVTASAGGVEVFAGSGTQGAPLISSARGVMQALRCRILPEKMIDVSDHTVVVAEVLGIMSAPEKRLQSQAETAATGEQRMGLVYGDRRYRGVGPEISVEGGSVESGTDGRRIDFQQTQQLNLRRGDEAQKSSRSS